MKKFDSLGSIQIIGFVPVILSLLCSSAVFAQDVDDIFKTLNAPDTSSSSKQDPKKALDEPPSEKSGDSDKPPSSLDRFFSGISEDLSWGGYFRNETAYRVIRPSAFDKILNIFRVDGRYQISPVFSLTGRVRAYYNTVCDIESIDTISPRREPDTILAENLTREQIAALTVNNVRQVELNCEGIELKELYLDAVLKNFDLRVGRQIVRWGVVEGSRVNDVINPLDFEELILRDVDDRYIPLIMFKADYYLGESAFEFIWIPEVRGHRPAPRGSQWEQFRFLSNFEKADHAWKDFPNNLENSELAFRYSHVFSWAEISLSYFYTWDDFPSSFRTISQAGFFGTEPSITFEPRYTRLQIYGTTFSKSFRWFVFNSEATYVTGKHFGTRIESLPDVANDPLFGELKRNYVKYAVGLDTTQFGIDISPAVIQQYIFDHDEQMIIDKWDTVGALFIRKGFFHNLFDTDLLVLWFVNDRDWLVRPRVRYYITERVRVSFGADIFEGKIGSGVPGEFHFIGFFDNNDRIFFHVTYSF